MVEVKTVDLKMLKIEQYEALKETMLASYPNMPHAYWREHQIENLLKVFPEGQVVVFVNGQLAGCALSIIVEEDLIEGRHTYKQITGNYTFATHTRQGHVLYGIDVFIKPEFRGLRIGRRLYDYRKELCERLNLKSIAFGGRIPGYHKYETELTPKQYIEKVKRGEIHDSVLNFQLSNDFHPIRILQNYLEGDTASGEYAVLMEWDNIYYEKPGGLLIKTTVRLGLVQWQMRLYKNYEEMIQQIEYFIDSVSAYRSDFAVFPEFFNAPLMANDNHLSASEAVRKLATYTSRIQQKFSELAVSYNINIITGSMPEVTNGKLRNVGYLCRRDGSSERYEKYMLRPMKNGCGV